MDQFQLKEINVLFHSKFKIQCKFEILRQGDGCRYRRLPKVAFVLIKWNTPLNQALLLLEQVPDILLVISI